MSLVLGSSRAFYKPYRRWDKRITKLQSSFEDEDWFALFSLQNMSNILFHFETHAGFASPAITEFY